MTQPCSGLVFRCRRNIFINSRGEIIKKLTLSPLKKKSCPGCDKCLFMEEFLTEEISSGADIPGMATVEDGKIYQFVLRNSGLDFETGIIDDFWLELHPYTEVSNDTN